MTKTFIALAETLRSIQNDAIVEVRLQGHICLRISRLHAIAQNDVCTTDELNHISNCKKCQARIAQLRGLILGGDKFAAVSGHSKKNSMEFNNDLDSSIQRAPSHLSLRMHALMAASFTAIIVLVSILFLMNKNSTGTHSEQSQGVTAGPAQIVTESSGKNRGNANSKHDLELATNERHNQSQRTASHAVTQIPRPHVRTLKVAKSSGKHQADHNSKYDPPTIVLEGDYRSYPIPGVALSGVDVGPSFNNGTELKGRLDNVRSDPTRTFVSGAGDDSYPCSRIAPCKTFAGAVSKTAAGGEIDALDPGGFGAVTITKSITIDGGSGQVASVLVAGTNGIVVEAQLNDVVILRNLKIDGHGSGLNGIRFLSGKNLNVENCVIFDFSQAGIEISLANSASAFITGTTIENIGQVGIKTTASSGVADVRISKTKISSTPLGLEAADYSRVLMTNSLIENASISGIRARTSAQIQIKDVTLSCQGKNRPPTKCDGSSQPSVAKEGGGGPGGMAM